MDKKHCHGCRDDFYNGNNPMGVKVCWCLADAKLVPRVIVHIDQRPPWTQKPKALPDCYSMDRHVLIRPDHPSCKPRPPVAPVAAV